MKRTGILAWFAANHVATNILMVFILAAGILAAHIILVEVFPELESDIINIRVTYLGAAPSEVEEGVCMRVEEAIASIEGIERIRSIAQENMGTVTVELDEDTDNRKALDEIKNEVDRIETFPVETEKPVISEITNRTQVITVVLHGDVPESTLKYLAEQVRDELTAKDEITQVELAGVRRFEISIEISEESLRRWGLTFGQVSDAVRQASLDMPGGSVKTAGGEILLRAKGQRYRGREFEEIVVVTRPDGTVIRLADVAEVIDGFEDSDVASRFDGAPAASVRVFRVGDQGALEVADVVKEYVEELTPRLPNGISVSTWEDRSMILRSRMELLIRNGLLGLILVLISLGLFLEARVAFWTTMGIPISFLGGLFIIYQSDVSINMISLFAFIVSLGIVVDDAIVVGENVFAYREQGMDPLSAAIKGVHEMAIPVSFAILTTVAAFLPLMFTAGQMGKIMRQIPIVVCAVLLVSLVEALLILPAHLSGKRRQRELGAIGRFQLRFRRGLESFIQRVYAPVLDLSLRNRYITVATAIAIFLITVSLIIGGFIKFTFMPEIDSDNLVAQLTMPQGTPLDQTRNVVKRLETAAEQMRQEYDEQRPPGATSVIRHMQSSIGEQPRASRSGGPAHGGTTVSVSGSHLAELNVELLSSEERGISSVEMVNRWRELVGEVAGASSLTFTSSLFSVGEDINIELSHQHFDTLLRAADRLKEVVSEYPGVSDVADSFMPGKIELKLDLKPEGRALGLTLADLARQVRQGFYGDEAQRIQRGRDDIRVMVRYPEAARETLHGIEQMRVRLPGGAEVPFRTVAEVSEGRGYAAINRTDRRRVVSITATVDEEAANANEINADLRSKTLPELRHDFPGLAYSFEGQQREQSESMMSMGINFLVALIAIFCLLAIPFRSYVQPIIVMSAIPFGIVGAVLGHLIMGFDLSMLSGFGIVALTGVVVNDSLIMIDLINREQKRGKPIEEVIRASGMRRFRPILLTTLTTFLGLMPMILESSLQARFLIPMAISLGFGVVFATGITLILVPCIYNILVDFKRLFVRQSVVEPVMAE
jgi:multidrug efflux pump subunit AcrB